MVFVCREHLRRWRKNEDDLHNLALQNLARSGGTITANDHEPVVVRSGDGFDAARVLLLEEAEGLLVAIPDRDTLWVGPESGTSLENLMATTAQIAERAAHPVSPSVWRVKDGRLAPATDRA